MRAFFGAVEAEEGIEYSVCRTGTTKLPALKRTGAELYRLGCDLNGLDFAMEVVASLQGIGMLSRPGPKIRISAQEHTKH